MTLIALQAEKDRARIMTDTWGYTFAFEMSTISKHTVIPHLDMAVAVQGSTGIHAHWLAALTLSCEQITDFDEVVRVSPDLLRALWATLDKDVAAENEETGARGAIANTAVFLVGLSIERSRYVAYAYASEQDFKPIDLTNLPYVQPTPLSSKPGPIEGPRLLRNFARSHIELDALDALERMPTLTPLQTEADWVELAQRVRADRAECDISSGFKTPVGGDVHLTTLTPGSAETKRIHRFSDDNESLLRIFAGSMHPLSQLGPCVGCGSGRPFVECCLAEAYHGKPCPCGSPDNFEDCCSVLAGHVAAPGVNA